MLELSYLVLQWRELAALPLLCSCSVAVSVLTVSLPRGTVDWSLVCYCVIFWSYSTSTSTLAFLTLTMDHKIKYFMIHALTV